MIQSVKKFKYKGKLVTYFLTYESGEKLSVPVTEGEDALNNQNRHYQDILKWVTEGNTIEEAD
jgi:hypothetical protein